MSASPPDLYVAVVGGNECPPDVADQAATVGRLLAHEGVAIVCGGLGGVMEATCRGAHEAGGLTIGFLPEAHRRGANSYLSVAIPTGIGEMRNMLVVRAADAVIALDGEFGTLSEIGFALRLGTPVVGLSTWELSKGGRASTAIETVDTPEEAVRRAVELASARSNR